MSSMTASTMLVGTLPLLGSDAPTICAIFARSTEDAAQAEHDAFVLRLKRCFPDLPVITESPRATLLASGALPIHSSYDGSVVLLGEAFPKGQGAVGSIVGPLRGDRPISAAKTVTDHLWGRYACISISQLPESCAWYRDPSGSQNLYAWSCGQNVVVADTIPPSLLKAAGRRPSINWESLAKLIRQTELSASFSALNDIDIVQPGMAYTLIDNRIERATIWSPARFASPREDMQVGQLPKLAASCVAHWVQGHSKVTLELSGGLDSSIVAGLLATTAQQTVIQALTIIPESPGGDERGYARSVASKWNFGLLETRVSPFQLKYLDHLDIEPRIEPAVYGLDILADRLSSQLADAFHATRIFSGQGGDAIFYQPHVPAIAADYFQRHGPTAGFFRQLCSIALANNFSVWAALRSALRTSAVLDRREIPATIAGPIGKSAWESELLVHPWVAEIKHLPLGKQMQIAMLSHCQLFHRTTSTGANRRLVHPLLSQPLVEACLSIPSWQLVPDRRERGLARDLFRHLLPEPVLQRRGKGEASGFYNRVIDAHLPALRPLLVEGMLARSGLIATDALDGWLTTEHLLWKDDHPTIGSLISLEIWAQQWAS